MEYSIFEIWTCFIIYSMAGWILESVYRSFCEKKLINTGFLQGPFCPIYGIGAIIMFLFLGQFKQYIFLLFIISFFVLSVWEYIVGVLLEAIFKTKYWDYSSHRFNIKGRVCLFNSIAWGILGVLFVRYIHPFVQDNLNKVEPYILNFVIYSISICFIIDTIISVVTTINIKTALERIEDLNNQIKDKLDEVKKLSNKNLKDDLTENIQMKVEVLKKRKNKLLRNLYKRANRLKNAFPDIQSSDISKILNTKIDFKKNDKDKTKEEK